MVVGIGIGLMAGSIGRSGMKYSRMMTAPVRCFRCRSVSAKGLVIDGASVLWAGGRWPGGNEGCADDKESNVRHAGSSPITEPRSRISRRAVFQVIDDSKSLASCQSKKRWRGLHRGDQPMSVWQNRDRHLASLRASPLGLFDEKRRQAPRFARSLSPFSCPVRVPSSRRRLPARNSWQPARRNSWWPVPCNTRPPGRSTTRPGECSS